MDVDIAPDLANISTYKLTCELRKRAGIAAKSVAIDVPIKILIADSVWYDDFGPVTVVIDES